MSQQTVLYDVLGPKGKRRVAIGTGVAALLIAGLLYVVVSRLAARGQFDAELWAPVVNPASERFDLVWGILADGVVNTLKAAVVAMVLSVVLGTLIAVARLSMGKVAQIPLIGFIELFRGLPVVILIYFGVRVLPDVGVDLSGLPGGQQLWGLVLGLTAYNAVIFAEVVRAGVVSLPKGQREAALATGLTDGQTMRLVLLPQAFRVMLPAIISQLVVVLKDTSLVAFVGSYEELLRSGERIQRNLDNPIQVFFVVALIFIALNFALSKLAEFIQRRQARAGRASVEGVEAQTTNTGA